MCEQSKVLEAEYKQLRDSYDAYGLLTTASVLVFVGTLLWNGPVVAAIITGIVAYISYTKMNAVDKKMDAKWQQIQGTGCATVDDARHERYRTQQQQYQQPRYEFAPQPLTQNPLDVNELVQSYARESRELRLTASGIQIIRDEQQPYIDAEYVEHTPRFQLPPANSCAIVRRQQKVRKYKGGGEDDRSSETRVHGEP